MSNERKRPEKKEIPKPVPKKRPELPVEIKQKVKISDDKYIRLASDSNQYEFKSISERIHMGELKWAYFATDGSKSYHYYLIIK